MRLRPRERGIILEYFQTRVFLPSRFHHPGRTHNRDRCVHGPLQQPPTLFQDQLQNPHRVRARIPPHRGNRRINPCQQTGGNLRLDSVGLGLNLSQLVLYLIGVLLLAIFSYNLVGRSFRLELAPALVSVGATFVALATVSPCYPDMTYLGLATAAVWAASRNLVLLFIGLSLLTSLTCETGILLFLVWIAYAWSAKKFTVIYYLPALVPLFAYVAVRFLVQVPESDLKYQELFDFASGRFSPPLVYGIFSIITIGFITPRISRLFVLGVDKKLAIAESIIWIVGAFSA
jgi:hypothetical protein